MIPLQGHMSVLEAAQWALPFHMDAVWSCDDGVTGSRNRKPAHRMRIAVKYLRYNLELFSGLAAGGFANPLKMIKKLQELLGEIHDLDVRIDALRERIGAENGRQREEWKRIGRAIRQENQTAAAVRAFGTMLAERPFGGLVELLAHQIDRREKRYAAFLRHWRHMKKIHLEKDIRDALFPKTAEERSDATG